MLKQKKNYEKRKYPFAWSTTMNGQIDTQNRIVESSVSGVLFSMRISNLSIATCMTIVAIAQMITEESFWSAVSDIFSVFYTL